MMAPTMRGEDRVTEFWLNAQRAVDLWDASKAATEKIAQITPLSAA
jgi:plasmid maintenance system antidote protein VapI